MAEAAARKAAAENAITQQKRLQDESLRWKVAMALGVVWIGLTVYAWLGVSLKDWWHDFSWKWERDHSPALACTRNWAVRVKQGYNTPSTSCTRVDWYTY